MSLKEIINGRPVAIVLPGPSVQEFIDRRKEFEKFDWCYLTINKFWVLEEYFKFDIVCAFCKHVRKTIDEKYKDKLNGKKFITGYNSKYDGRYLNTLFLVLLMLIGKDVKNIYLFGADGLKGKKLYFNKDYPEEEYAKRFSPKQTSYLNNQFPKHDIEIINCSTNSQYTRFPKMTYDEFLAHISN